MTQDSLNDLAQKRFSELKTKLKLDISSNLQKDKEAIRKLERLTDEEFQEFSKMPEVLEIDEIKKKEVDTAFGFIDSLGLSPNLSLAIGLIVAGYKTGNKDNFIKAMETLDKEL